MEVNRTRNSRGCLCNVVRILIGASLLYLSLFGNLSVNDEDCMIG